MLSFSLGKKKIMSKRYAMRSNCRRIVTKSIQFAAQQAQFLCLLGCFGFMLFMPFLAQAQDKPAYQLYNPKGKSVNYNKLLQAAQNADVVFFGELHNNPIAHWLQFELIHDLHLKGKSLVVGAEMIERHQQWAVDAYFNGTLNTEAFEDTIKLWPNYPTDYKPILEYARQQGFPFIGTNIPRKYASQVFRQGLASLDTLSPVAKAEIAPLPITIDYELPSYQKMLEMMGAHNNAAPTDKALNFVAAQAVKDATMAHFAYQSWQAGKTMVHLNGSFHSDFGEGIVWYLKKLNPSLRIVIITTVEQPLVRPVATEHLPKADFILVVPSAMTKTY
jgi:uncharacterized iron-regulated protein